MRLPYAVDARGLGLGTIVMHMARLPSITRDEARLDPALSSLRRVWLRLRHTHGVVESLLICCSAERRCCRRSKVELGCAPRVDAIPYLLRDKSDQQMKSQY